MLLTIVCKPTCYILFYLLTKKTNYPFEFWLYKPFQSYFIFALILLIAVWVIIAFIFLFIISIGILVYTLWCTTFYSDVVYRVQNVSLINKKEDRTQNLEISIDFLEGKNGRECVMCRYNLKNVRSILNKHLCVFFSSPLRM